MSITSQSCVRRNAGQPPAAPVLPKANLRFDGGGLTPTRGRKLPLVASPSGQANFTLSWERNSHD
ncbi:hypothetical protein SAMN05444149_103651 [Pseudosulfitobacter pseudonitzschiae]|nr:hypothetical protein SAMN05444149_103651 [Pseudosulfitobacter pseudonitzschiae]